MTLPASPSITRSPLRPASWMRPLSARHYAAIPSWLLVLPLLAIFAIGFLYPLTKLIALSFTGGPFANYRRLLDDPLYAAVLANTVGIATAVTLSSVFIGYPVALAMARLKWRLPLVIAACVFIPLWTSVLIRSYAWIVLLQRHGIVNSLLVATNLTDGPLKLLYTQGAVVLAMTHVLLPFVIVPIFSTLQMLPQDYARAARNLGAGAIRAFLFVTLPLSLPGVFAGATMCFVLALGFYITPALVGGPGSMLMANLIGQQTTVLLDWPFAAALSTVLLAMTIIFIVVFRKALSFSKGFSSVH